LRTALISLRTKGEQSGGGRFPCPSCCPLKQRLGTDIGINDPFPEKPKGMWARTYDCLLDEIFQAEMLANEAQSNILKRFAPHESPHFQMIP
jgi:hypothetical protein